MNVINHMQSYGWWEQTPAGWFKRDGTLSDMSSYFGQEPVSLDITLAKDFMELPEEGLSIRRVGKGMKIRPPWPLTFCAYDNQLVALTYAKDEIRIDQFYYVDGEVQKLNAFGTIGLTASGEFSDYAFRYGANVEDVEHWNIEVQKGCLSVVQALVFCHTRGVKFLAGEGEARAQRRRSSRDKPLMRHHTLSIPAVETYLRQSREARSEGGPKAFHLCRGHFARYTEDKPLFGSFVGRVWRAPHFRGKDLDHLVTKDYALTETK